MTADLDVVRHARARRMRLSVDPASGRVRLTIPPRASLKQAMAWANDHRGWIEAQRAKLPAGRPFVPGAVIPIEGEDVVIDWSPERSRTITLTRHAGLVPASTEPQDLGPAALWTPAQGQGDGALVCGGPLEGLPRRIETWLKRRALAVLTEETAEFAAKAGVTVSRVAVADPKGRWGSCASTGAIRYSWRLICAPPHVRRSTVAHEVAHRLHMDHSPAFHAAYRQLLGDDPAAARAWLRRHGATLHWVGRGG
ncbi:MAG TPA: SprT family zinc-dependent metalloprotease [Sphingomonas sp.]